MLPLQRFLDENRDSVLSAVFAVLAVAQLAAFWALCQSQVARAESRDARVHAERVADCLADPRASTHCPELMAEAGPSRAEHAQAER